MPNDDKPRRPTPSQVAASLRRLADLFETDEQFAAIAADAYLFQTFPGAADRAEELMSITHVTDDPARVLADLAQAACNAGLPVDDYRSHNGEWSGIQIDLGTFVLRPYVSRARLAQVAEVAP